MTARINDIFLLRDIIAGLKQIAKDRLTLAYLFILLFFINLGIFGPLVAPYGPTERVVGDGGQILLTAPPSIEHPMGTTSAGYDVLSRILYGARPTAIAGLLGGSMLICLGLTVGLTAGYVGGRLDTALMRMTDVAYSIPLLPFAIVIVSFLEVGYYTSILAIGALLWRGSARVIRSRVLQIREKPYIQAMEATGASQPRIIVRHILPNIATMAILFFAIGVGYTIIIQAGLTFIGAIDPFTPSWGVMIRNAYNSGYMSAAWWWSIPPGLLISLTVLSTFMFGRGYERISGQVDESVVQIG